ncbi:MAG: ribosome biogenesis GTP-binding protein YihA/YsxC [Nitrospinaceae bacterium]
MKIVSAEFLKGAVSAGQYPRGLYPEFAFAGRSNVGKSSLIRSLLNRKKLVRISSTPGKTQEINFFKINDALIFADLPGYGFAKVPPAIQRKWKRMIEQYLLQRETLTALVFIIDLRRDPTPLDLDLKDWLEANGIRYLLVATKSDKLSASERARRAEKIRNVFFGGSEKELIVFSSKNKTGRKELWTRILDLAGKGRDLSEKLQTGPP